MNIIIKKLNQCPQYAPILAHWTYLEWYRNRELEFDLVVKNYQKMSLSQELPCALVAITGTIPVAMATLKFSDLWSRKDLKGWLSSLYVMPDFRKQGIGEKLINDIQALSSDMNFSKLHLFLGQKEQDKLTEYYVKRNWKFLDDTIDNDNMPTKIYYYDLK